MFVRRAVVVFVLLSLGAATLSTREPPSFSCQRGVFFPQMECRSSSTWPIEPTWRVYYPGAPANDLNIADFDIGLFVRLTAPIEKWARVEMCFPTETDPVRCIGTEVGWWDGMLRRKR